MPIKCGIVTKHCNTKSWKIPPGSCLDLLCICVCICVCVCVCAFPPWAVITAGVKLLIENRSSCNSETKLCVCINISVSVCVEDIWMHKHSVCCTSPSARTCLSVAPHCVCICGMLPVIVMGPRSLWSRQRHGETDYPSVLWWQWSALLLTNLTSRYNIPLISVTNTRLQVLHMKSGRICLWIKHLIMWQRVLLYHFWRGFSVVAEPRRTALCF